MSLFNPRTISKSPSKVDYVAWGLIQKSFKIFQGWRSHSYSGHFFQCLTTQLADWCSSLIKAFMASVCLELSFQGETWKAHLAVVSICSGLSIYPKKLYGIQRSWWCCFRPLLYLQNVSRMPAREETLVSLHSHLVSSAERKRPVTQFTLEGSLLWAWHFPEHPLPGD